MTPSPPASGFLEVRRLDTAQLAPSAQGFSKPPSGSRPAWPLPRGWARGRICGGSASIPLRGCCLETAVLADWAPLLRAAHHLAAGIPSGELGRRRWAGRATSRAGAAASASPRLVAVLCSGHQKEVRRASPHSRAGGTQAEALGGGVSGAGSALPANLGLRHVRSLNFSLIWGLPGGPVAETLHSQRRGPGFNPWSGSWIPHDATSRCLVAQSH